MPPPATGSASARAARAIVRSLRAESLEILNNRANRLPSEPEPESEQELENNRNQTEYNMAENNDQTTESSKVKGMPSPEGRFAPKFDSETPDTLIRFMRRLEDLFVEHDVDSDKHRKEWAGKYADPGSEEEWRAFPEFEKGTWEDFKKVVIAAYPAAAHAAKGTVRKLKQICRANSRIGTDDLEALQTLIRAFRAEYVKLSKPPSVLSNREAVEMFLGCLNMDFRSQVYTRLSAREEKGTEERRVEDQFTLDQVMSTATQLSSGARGIFSQISASSGAPVQSVAVPNEVISDLDRVKQELALIMDRQMNQEKHIKQLAQNNVTPPMPAPRNTYQAPHRAAPPRNEGQPPPGYRCHYCHELGHFLAECPARANHEQQGKLAPGSERRVKWPDGTPVPREPSDRSMKDRVEQGQPRTMASQNYQGDLIEDYDYGDGVPGIISIPSSSFTGTYSRYLNQPYDHRDTLIEELTRKIQSSQQLAQTTYPMMMPIASQNVQLASHQDVRAANPETEQLKQALAHMQTEIANIKNQNQSLLKNQVNNGNHQAARSGF